MKNIIIKLIKYFGFTVITILILSMMIYFLNYIFNILVKTNIISDKFISFNGSIISSFISILVIYLTLQYYFKKDKYEEQIKTMPYINVSKYNSSENNHTVYLDANICFLNYKKGNDKYCHIQEKDNTNLTSIVLNLENVGYGPLRNLSIEAIHDFIIIDKMYGVEEKNNQKNIKQ